MTSLKSVPSTEITHVRFVNCTVRTVDIIWLNFQGREVKYSSLKSHGMYDVTTYTKHPWIFRDHVWKSVKYCIKNKPVFYPQQTFSSSNMPVRKLVRILPEVYQLKDICLRQVFDLTPKTAMDKLKIPSNLVEELKRIDKID